MELYATQDPEVVMIVSIYDMEENSAAVWEKGKQIHNELHEDPNNKLLYFENYLTFIWCRGLSVGADVLYHGYACQHVIVLTGDSYKVFTAAESCDSYYAINVSKGEPHL